MIPRYTRPEMGAIWSDARRYETWLEVELAATDALAATGVVPAGDARTLRERAAFDIARIEEIEQTTQHDVIAFTTAVAEKVGPAARWLHFGLTSSDVLDTGFALQLRAAADVLLAELEQLLMTTTRLALRHRDTVMAVWEAYRGGTLTETEGPVVPETSPFRPKPRRVPLPVADDAVRPTHGEPVGAQLGQAGDSDRV